ncbi:MAG: fliW [Vampirovibrio sp.]|jgi:flagellar assembly factor FliW|nr:fliW [Vampirovibrio sp.]
MTQMIINTARFGEVEVAEDRLIHFVEPILGFEKSFRYIILDHAEDSPFKWLQSAEEPELAFVVTNPKFFGIDYEFELSDELVTQLKLEAADDALVLTIVNIPQEDPGKMTTNLLGPIVINQSLRKAMQVVLSDTGYSTKARLIPDELLQPSSSAASRTASEKGD